MNTAAKYLVLLMLGSAPLGAPACIHPPTGYKGAAISEREKVAFMFHDGANAHLVLRTTLVAEKGLPASMAWVIPLPSLPSRYEEVPSEVFSQLERITRIETPARERAQQAKPASAKAEPPRIRILPAQVVGSYRVQPIEILAASAGRELNAWLSANGFSEVPAENQKFYLAKGAAFIALRATGLTGAAAELKPLHIVYKDDRMRLPLKFSTHSGVFDVRLYVLTRAAPSASALEPFGFTRTSESFAVPTGGIPDAQHVTKLIGPRSGFITEYRARSFNAPCNPASALREDPWLMPDGRGSGAASVNSSIESCLRAEEQAARASSLAAMRTLESQDGPGAVRAYMHAARGGNGAAALRLSEIYAQGIAGVPRDEREAVKWRNAARALGEDVPAAGRRDR